CYVDLLNIGEVRGATLRVCHPLRDAPTEPNHFDFFDRRVRRASGTGRFRSLTDEEPVQILVTDTSCGAGAAHLPQVDARISCAFAYCRSSDRSLINGPERLGFPPRLTGRHRQDRCLFGLRWFVAERRFPKGVLSLRRRCCRRRMLL